LNVFERREEEEGEERQVVGEKGHKDIMSF
jgi:hypothetical protein